MWQHWSILHHSPDLAPADFYVFLHWNQHLKGRRFCDATDIIKNATEELKRLSQNGFLKSFQHFYNRWQKCMVAQWWQFEGYVAYIGVLFCIYQKYSDSGNILKLPRIPCFRSPVPCTVYTRFKKRINGSFMNETTLNFQDRSHMSSCRLLRLPTVRNSLLPPDSGSKQYNNFLYRLLKTWTYCNHGIL
jgi:hypothetical protein